jgi:hypothetical protein
MDSNYYKNNKTFKKLCDLNLEMADLTLEWLNEVQSSSNGLVSKKIITKAAKIAAALTKFAENANKQNP